MSVTDTTARGQTRAIAFEIDLRHPPEKVWRALTDPALLSQWLLTVADLDVAPGVAFTLRAPPQPGWDGTVACRFVVVEPLRSLSYTWVVGDLDTVVTFSLAPTPAGTHLSVVQTGFRPDQQRNFGGARYGWRLMGERLVTLLGGSS